MSTRRLWIGGYGPEASSHGRGLAAFRAEVEERTGNEVEVEITWNIMSEGRPNTDLFDLVEGGHMFLCYFSSSYLGALVNDLNVLETPYLFEDLEAAHHALDGRLGESLVGAVRALTGFEVLGFFDNGFRHFTNRLRPVHTPGDCSGMSVRMQPNQIHEELIRCWGAIPIAVDLSNAVQLITSGSVDAQENPLANTVAYGVDRVHPFVTMTGHLYGARGLFANRSAYERLPLDVRDAVDHGIAVAVQTQREAAARAETDLRLDMETAGIEFVDLTPDERQSFVTASTPAVDLARSLVPRHLFDLSVS
jgi:TRAP-type transport system periplasmic protein